MWLFFLEPWILTYSLCLDRDFGSPDPMKSGLGISPQFGRDVGWLYLAAVLDLFSRRMVGWAMTASADETLLEMALRMALLKRRPQAG